MSVSPVAGSDHGSLTEGFPMKAAEPWPATRDQVAGEIDVDPGLPFGSRTVEWASI